MNISKRLSVCLALGGSLVAAGCGGAPAVDTSTVEANVSGAVKIDGVPVKEGELLFDASNYQRTGGARTAQIKDGNYTVKTLTGQNTVKITGKVARSKPLLQTQTRSVEVKSGDNTFDIDFIAK